VPGRPSRCRPPGAGTASRGGTRGLGWARPWPSVESRRCPRPRDRPGRRPLCVRGHCNASTHS